MSYLSNPHAPYEISIDCQGASRFRTQLRLDDVNALPTVVKKLSEMGYDLSDTAKALREVEEEQCKRKVDELNENRRMALAGLDAKSKRFVIAYNKVGKTWVGTAEGVIYSDDSIHIANSMQHPFGGHYKDTENLESLVKTKGYELFVKRFD